MSKTYNTLTRQSIIFNVDIFSFFRSLSHVHGQRDSAHGAFRRRDLERLLRRRQMEQTVLWLRRRQHLDDDLHCSLFRLRKWILLLQVSIHSLHCCSFECCCVRYLIISLRYLYATDTAASWEKRIPLEKKNKYGNGNITLATEETIWLARRSSFVNLVANTCVRRDLAEWKRRELRRWHDAQRKKKDEESRKERSDNRLGMEGGVARNVLLVHHVSLSVVRYLRPLSLQNRLLSWSWVPLTYSASLYAGGEKNWLLSDTVDGLWCCVRVSHFPHRMMDQSSACSWTCFLKLSMVLAEVRAAST